MTKQWGKLNEVENRNYPVLSKILRFMRSMFLVLILKEDNSSGNKKKQKDGDSNNVEWMHNIQPPLSINKAKTKHNHK